MKHYLWKTFDLSDGRDTTIESVWQGMKRDSKYTMEFQPDGSVETNLPYSELRAIFKLIGSRMPSEHVTDTMPSWKRYND